MERAEVKKMKEQVLAVQRMQDYIEQNLSQDIHLSGLARAAMFSPWYSYRLFREYLELTPQERETAAIYEPVGCQRCNGTGYYDRIGIYEIMEITPPMRTMISHRCPTGELRDAAIAEGMHTLSQSARRLVLEGVTSITEMQRISVEQPEDEKQTVEEPA